MSPSASMRRWLQPSEISQLRRVCDPFHFVQRAVRHARQGPPSTSESATQSNLDRKSTRLNSSHLGISYFFFFSLHDALPICYGEFVTPFTSSNAPSATRVKALQARQRVRPKAISRPHSGKSRKHKVERDRKSTRLN